MEEYTYTIKIKGSGTQKEIVAALCDLVRTIEEASVAELDGAEWQEETLTTEIKAD